MSHKPGVLNDESKIAEARAESVKYIEDHPDVSESVAKAFSAYRVVGNLVPETLDNMMSGHFPLFRIIL